MIASKSDSILFLLTLFLFCSNTTNFLMPQIAILSDFKDDDNEHGHNCSGWEGRRGSPGATIASSSSHRSASPLVLAMSGGSPMSPIRMEVSVMGANLQ